MPSRHKILNQILSKNDQPKIFIQKTGTLNTVLPGWARVREHLFMGRFVIPLYYKNGSLTAKLDKRGLKFFFY